MPVENSQLYARLPHPCISPGSKVAPGTGRPKLGLAMAPHSPLIAGSRRLQSGMKFRFVSPHDRVVWVIRLLRGFGSWNIGAPADRTSRYLFRLTFTAVFPLPKTS